MYKDQFIGKHQNLNISQKELERKWQTHVREQEEVWFRNSEAPEADDAVITDKSNAVYCLYVKEN
jgi:hypothetical protein